MDSQPQICQPTSFKIHPFSRLRPVEQRAWRSDGRRLKDGAGLGSPLVVEPGHLLWDGSLSFIRNSIEESLSSSVLPQLTHRLAVLSDLKGALEDGEDLQNLPFGMDSEVPPELPLVKQALAQVQLSFETETKRLAGEPLPRARTVARAAG